MCIKRYSCFVGVFKNIVNDGIVSELCGSGESVLEGGSRDTDGSGGVPDHLPALEIKLSLVGESVGFRLFIEEHSRGFPAEFIGKILAGRLGCVFGHDAVTIPYVVDGIYLPQIAGIIIIHEFHKTGEIEPVNVPENTLIKNPAGGVCFIRLGIVVIVKGNFFAAVVAKLLRGIFADLAAHIRIARVASVKRAYQKLDVMIFGVDIHGTEQYHDRNGNRNTDRRIIRCLFHTGNTSCKD